MKIKAPRDFWAGLMFIAFGLGFLIVAGNYAMGTAVRMGPAYFPTVLGGILALLGFAIFAQSFFVKGDKVPPIIFRPMTLIVLGIVLFGVTLKPLGLIVATALLISIGALGGHEFKTKEVVILFVILALFAVLVFVKGLGLPIPVCPAVLDDWCRSVHIGN